ncbi:ABC transporter permease [Lachnospiraceae bacterium 42-17]
MKKWLSRYSQQIFLFAVMVLICIVLTAQSKYFLTWKNIRNILEANSYRLILAIGMTFVIASGVMDLSAGAIVSMCGVIMAVGLHAGLCAAAAVILGIFSGAAMGAANGILIHYTGINFFILTLAASGMLRGISLMITDGKPITRFGQEFIFLGIGRTGEMQLSVIFAVLLVLLCIPLMFYMKWGNYVTALGGSKDALEKSGIHVGCLRISVHMFLGAMAAVTAVIITARLNSAEPNAGMNMELDAITAVIMGGTAISGGRASIGGTVLAVIILGVVRNGLTLMSVSSDYQQWITGFLLLVSVLISEIRVHKTRVLMK